MSYSKYDKEYFLKLYRDNLCNIAKTVKDFEKYSKENYDKETSFWRGTYYNWVDEDSEFADKIDNANWELAEDAEHVLKAEAVVKHNMTALIFFLKNKHPDYRPKMSLEGDIGVQNSYTNLSNEELYDILNHVKQTKNRKNEEGGTGGNGDASDGGDLSERSE